MTDIARHLAGIRALKRISTRPVSYADVERATFELAARLTAEFNQEALWRFQYLAIPRGGLFVLGALSYILELYHVQFQETDTDRPLVLVDDCSLSGARFAHFIQSLGDREIIFAHLYSHPQLRAQIRAQEPNVIACLAAHDLRDLPGQDNTLFHDEVESPALEAWHSHPLSKRYWSGQCEIPIFPWSEPDHAYWNPFSESIEDRWRLASPDICLKNWALLRVPPRRVEDPTYRLPADLAYNVSEDSVILCRLSSEEIFGFEGTAAVMWRALAAYGDEDATVAFLLQLYDVDRAALTSDVRGFIDQLLTHHLLERTGRR